MTNLLTVIATSAMSFSPAQGSSPARQMAFQIEGLFVKGCSCKQACTFELIGADSKCEAMGAFSFVKGIHGGKSFAGTRVAFAASPAGWLELFVDGNDDASKRVAADFMKSALKSWGKLDKPVFTTVSFTGFDGRYSVSVDGGRIMQLRSGPYRDKAKKGIVTFNNVYNKTLHRNLYQCTTIEGLFDRGARHIKLVGTNGFFNPRLKESGRL